MSSEHDDRFWAALPLPPDCADDEPGFADEFGVTPGEVRAWLAKDPARQHRAAELEAELASDLETLIELRHGRSLPSIMDGFTDRVMAEVKPAPKAGQLVVFRRYGLAAAAALLFAVILGAVWGGGDEPRPMTAKEPTTTDLPRRASDDVRSALPVLASAVPTPKLLPGVSPRSMRSLEPQVPVGRASGTDSPTNNAGDLLLRKFLEDLPNLRENLEELRRQSEPAEDETFRF